MILFEDENVRVAAHQGRITIFDKLAELDRIATDDEAEHWWDHWTRHGHVPSRHPEAQDPDAPAARQDDG